jgi:hypothetical protein
MRGLDDRAKRPCHVCGRLVMHYTLGGLPARGNRGSRPHKCPHGQQCRGGDRLHRWSYMGYVPNCAPCSERLKQLGSRTRKQGG